MSSPSPENQAAECTNRSRKRRNKLFFLMGSGATSILLLVIGGYQLMEFTDSTAFCGRLCHNVMYPEYTAYQASPHSRVACAECHVGSGAGYLVKSKVSGMPMIFATLTGRYERPIPTPVENLRPARETCEQCHRPEKFSGDLVRVRTSYQSDESNTERVDTRVLKVGGGESGVARDIHWHIAAKLWYLALDDARQEIGWVGVEGADGGLTEYIDPARAAEVNPERISAEKRLMDCIDCHNRATHVFQSPSSLIDGLLYQGKIDKTLPYIKREAFNALDPSSGSLKEALDKVAAISEFYRVSYPEVYTAKKAAIDDAVRELGEVARLTTFPEMKIDWRTYVNNAGHQESPGCLRCHGKLQATSGVEKGKVVNADCDSCHYFRL